MLSSDILCNWPEPLWIAINFKLCLIKILEYYYWSFYLTKVFTLCSLVMYFCFPLAVCDQKFFSELMKEASDIAGYFSSKVQHLLHLHIAKGLQRYVLRMRQCFKNDREALAQEGRILIEYITMNAIAMRKILKKYDKVRIKWDNCCLVHPPPFSFILIYLSVFLVHSIVNY